MVGRALRPLRLVAAALVVFAPRAIAQTPVVQQSSQYFQPQDALEINTYAIADLSDDGKWIALTQQVRRDAYGTDYRHDGDPTYVHPVPVRL
jgi:hypothetical protein